MVHNQSGAIAAHYKILIVLVWLNVQQALSGIVHYFSNKIINLIEKKKKGTFFGFSKMKSSRPNFIQLFRYF